MADAPLAWSVRLLADEAELGPHHEGEEGEEVQRDGRPLADAPHLETEHPGQRGEEMGGVDRSAVGQDVDDIEVAEGEDGREEDDHCEDRLEKRERDVPEARVRVRAVRLGRLVELAGDGANANARFWHITLPLLKPV